MKTLSGLNSITQRTIQTVVLALVVVGFVSTPVWGQFAIEQPPINYLKTSVNDPISQLQKKLDAGEVKLHFDRKHGYLESVLKQLDVPQSSQVLVYSKTSFQVRNISPRTPRAVYFNDDVYIGWVQGGKVVEVSSVDPRLGANFYSLDQHKTEAPAFKRRTYECLQCHSSSLTRGVPGHLVRSVYTGPDGLPIFSAGTYLSDHSSPLKERWGGWYVSGEHGAQRHLGNLLVRQSDDPENLDTEKGANAHDLSQWFETDPYLKPYSDIVALMVMEHQVNMQNRITRANFSTLLALRDGDVMNEMMERPASHRSDATTRRLHSAAEPVVKHLLFAEEISLSSPVSGLSGFTKEFAARGPFDKQGRSLRQFDLTTRLFKYPCSYLIYSKAFNKLPPPLLEDVYLRLWQVLTGEDTTAAFAHLTKTDRRAILEILRDTKKNLPEYWTLEKLAAKKPTEASKTASSPATLDPGAAATE